MIAPSVGEDAVTWACVLFGESVNWHNFLEWNLDFLWTKLHVKSLKNFRPFHFLVLLLGQPSEMVVRKHGKVLIVLRWQFGHRPMNTINAPDSAAPSHPLSPSDPWGHRYWRNKNTQDGNYHLIIIPHVSVPSPAGLHGAPHLVCCPREVALSHVQLLDEEERDPWDGEMAKFFLGRPVSLHGWEKNIRHMAHAQRLLTIGFGAMECHPPSQPPEEASY